MNIEEMKERNGEESELKNSKNKNPQTPTMTNITQEIPPIRNGDIEDDTNLHYTSNRNIPVVIQQHEMFRILRLPLPEKVITNQEYLQALRTEMLRKKGKVIIHTQCFLDTLEY